MVAELSGRRVLVTGSTRGIGQAIAPGFVRNGARVVVNSDCAEPLGEDSGAHFIQADAGDVRDYRRLVDDAVAWLGGLDVLVNCAATVFMRSLVESDDREIERALAVNLRGPSWSVGLGRTDEAASVVVALARGNSAASMVS